MNFSWKYAYFKLLTMLTSRKFIVLLLGALGAYGLGVTDEVKALILFLAAALYTIIQGYEDVGEDAKKVTKIKIE